MAGPKKIGPDNIRIVSEIEDEFLEGTIGRNQLRMSNAIRGLENKMLANLKKIELSTSGRVEGAKVNLKQTQAIHRQMVKDFEELYGAEARAMVSDFSRIDDLISNSWEYLGEPGNFTGIEKGMQKALQNTASLQFKQFGEEAMRKVDDAMYASIVGGQPYSTLVAAVAGALTGHKDAKGRPMEMYARQYAFDSTMNYHNQVNLQKAEGLDINHFLYVGDIMASSRRFCKRRAGKVYTRGQINSWNETRWDGKSGPAFTHRGGYNCRHHWRPVRPDWLDGAKEVDVADWRVGSSARRDKPPFLRKTAGTRGWNEYTADERLILTQLRSKIRTGKPLTMGQKQTKFFFNSLNQAERDAFILAYEKEGLTVPDILRRGASVKPPVPKPPTTPTATTTPTTQGREWSQLGPYERKQLYKIRKALIEHSELDPKQLAWWETKLSDGDRQMVIERWRSKGIEPHQSLLKTTPTVTPVPTPTPPPVIKPPATTPTTGTVSPTGPPTVGARRWQDLGAYAQKQARYAEKKLLAGGELDASFMKWWDSKVPDVDKQVILARWEKKGIDVSRFTGASGPVTVVTKTPIGKSGKVNIPPPPPQAKLPPAAKRPELLSSAEMEARWKPPGTSIEADHVVRSTWEPVESMVAAKAQFKHKFNFWGVHLDETIFDKGTSLKKINDMGRMVAEMYRKCPGMNRRMSAFRKKLKKLYISDRERGKMATIYNEKWVAHGVDNTVPNGWYEVYSKKIYARVNVDFAGADLTDYRLTLGQFKTMKDHWYTVRHEIGHHFQNMGKRAEWEKIFKANRDNIRRHLSVYGAEEADEAWAEIFAYATHPETSLDDLHPSLDPLVKFVKKNLFNE